ncbi:MAG: NACHT domain-containing protein [Coleofasciculaceae cyanobacterium]
MSLPPEFLAQIAYDKKLSPKEEDVLIELFARDKSRLQVAESLHISESSLSTHLTGIYNKFNISGRGPIKERLLQEYLTSQYSQSHTSASPLSELSGSELEALVQQVREQVQVSILERCGRVEMQDITFSVGLSDIYVDVQLSDKIPSRSSQEIEELLSISQQDDFERIQLSQVSEKRVSGLEAAQRHHKLMVVGKPGAGKTIFLKYLALQCSQGKFQKQLVPVFIPLKDLTKNHFQSSLLDYVSQQFLQSGVTDSQVKAEQLLTQGRVLILLDGLEDLLEANNRKIIQDIQFFLGKFSTNFFVITCRIATETQGFLPEFIEMEIADFDNQQIQVFTQKWLRALKKQIKAEDLLKNLQENQQIHELATNPLLLTALCLIFDQKVNYSVNTYEIYDKVIEFLLLKWDESYNEESNHVYQSLSPRRKQDLLGKIALSTFERSSYFFKSQEVKEDIFDYIRNLPNASKDSSLLQIDSQNVLKSAVVQSGFLLARSQGIYSFSHLSFHEYFAAREIVEIGALETLVNRITDKNWHEVFLLTTCMMRNADELIRLMKQKIDRLLAKDGKLQEFLNWVNQQSASLNLPYSPAAIRSFYFACESGLNLDLVFFFVPNFKQEVFTRAWQTRTTRSQLDKSLLANQDQPLNLSQQLQQANYLAESQQLLEYNHLIHDWGWSQQQKELLQQYYDVNKLLMDCLKSDCYVTREVRQEIEDTLLLSTTL